MKNGLLLFALIGFVFSCTNDDSNNSSEQDLIGTWKLTETLADPGDGSGVFTTVTSEKNIQFFNDGTVTSNGSICDMSIQSDNASDGTFSITDSTINSPECFNSGFNITFELTSTFLILNYPCIEPCRAKFIKVE